MPVKKLPVNGNSDITSYVHHSYINAILDNSHIITLYVQNMQNYHWDIAESDVIYELNNELLKLTDKDWRKSDSFFIRRECNSEDEIIVKVKDIRLLNPLTYIQVSISTEEQLMEEDNPDFYLKWDQNDITIKKYKMKFDLQLYMYYKVSKVGKRVSINISRDKILWEELYEQNLETDVNSKLFFYIKLYFGKSQYSQWKYMNYIQLHYREFDQNGVYLDYFMFPRKVWDASYQYACHFLDTEYVKILDGLKYFGNIQEYIKYCIRQDYYLNIQLDEYYVKDRFAYQNRHYDHYNLFWGYNDNARVFYILGYNERGKVAVSELPYDVFSYKIYRGTTVVRYKYRTNSSELEFRKELVTQSIYEYYHGIDSSIKYSNILTSKSAWYGLNIFDRLIQSEKGVELLKNDKRISFVLYEHCRLMKNRLNFLNESGYLNGMFEPLMLKCEKMVDISEILKNMVIMHNIRPKKESEILNQLQALHVSEKDFYYMLLEVMNIETDVLLEKKSTPFP